MSEKLHSGFRQVKVRYEKYLDGPPLSEWRHVPTCWHFGHNGKGVQPQSGQRSMPAGRTQRQIEQGIGRSVTGILRFQTSVTIVAAVYCPMADCLPSWSHFVHFLVVIVSHPARLDSLCGSPCKPLERPESDHRSTRRTWMTCQSGDSRLQTMPTRECHWRGASLASYGGPQKPDQEIR